MKSMFEKGDYELEVNVKGIRMRHYDSDDGKETVLTYSWINKTYLIENANEYEVEQFRKIVRFILTGGKQ